nr:hypothetical protein [Paracoccus siganidrum]
MNIIGCTTFWGILRISWANAGKRCLATAVDIHGIIARGLRQKDIADRAIGIDGEGQMGLVSSRGHDLPQVRRDPDGAGQLTLEFLLPLGLGRDGHRRFGTVENRILK